MSTISGYHAHVYFDAAERERAQRLCEAAHAAFGVTVGRMHDRPVGPHPRGSCQLTVGTDQFAAPRTDQLAPTRSHHLGWCGPRRDHRAGAAQS